ncbi:asparagine synthase (glutamine-hydrolyzing) [bacterium]|nr:asparagine synthase (glutamine-hydrolyzing) [bacterium]MBU1957078.1 asparagine synthase (glutamine-hydrolyzing) [bacterium]
MCGILGSFPNCDSNKFQKALNLLAHRGPDNQTVYESDTICLGHTRLSIIDLDAQSNQPMEIDDMVLIFNGEIYNYLEIKKELIALGYYFSTHSDTEVLLKSYQEWGEACVERFNGMWSFAIFDKKNNSLFLSRDRFGVKPLYYIYDSKRFVFASEIKALLPYLDQTVANRDEVVRYLVYGVQEHRKETMFTHIYRFPPGCNALYNMENKKLSFDKYYTLQIDIEETIDESLVKNKLKNLVEKSIDFRLRSDVKIGMALSGGVDSNIIVSKANAQNKTIESFSSIYDSKEQINENENIEHTVKSLNLKQHYIVAQIDSLVKKIENIVWMQDEPFDTLGIFAQYKVYEKMNEKAVKVSLDGQGADEIFAGYGTYRSVLLRENMFKYKFLREYFKYYKSFFIQDLKLLMISFFPKLFEWLYFKKRADKIFNKKVAFVPSLKESFSNFNNLNQKLVYDVKEYLSVLLRYVDRNSMAHSIESRAPFLDYKLINYAFELPSNLKYKDGFSKYILRKTFEKDVSEEIIWNRDKKGFPVPQNEWCTDENFIILAKKYISNSMILKELDINCNIDKHDPMYWKIVNIAIWEDVFKIEGIK